MRNEPVCLTKNGKFTRKLKEGRIGQAAEGGKEDIHGPNRSYSAKPVEAGKEYYEVTELSRRGDGIAKVQGFVIFVQGAKVGQRVKIKVDRVDPRFASATVVAHVGGLSQTPESNKNQDKRGP